MRKLIIAITFGALLLPNHAFTLGLGDIEVNSALNQELDAEISLLSINEGDEESLIVKLASRKEFQRAGLDRPFMLSSLKFTTEQKNGVPYIQVRSPKPIREPFLNFLVEVDWPQGHLIREFTLLLDPPVFTNRRAPEKAKNISRPAAREQQIAPPQEVEQNTDSFRPNATPFTTDVDTGVSNDESARPASQSQRSTVGGQYRIKKGDTTWSLANSLRPNNSVSVEKMMLALVRTNPDAFINENVNGLKRGYVLRVPDVSEINAMTNVEALALVREQNALWREYQLAMSSGKPLSGHSDNRRPSGAVSPSSSEGRLSIVGVGDANNADPTAMSSAELRSELAIKSEQLETERLEKEGLRNRLEALQSQVSNMKAIAAIEDRELAEMTQTDELVSTPAESEKVEPVVEEPMVKVEGAVKPVVEKIAKPAAATPKTLPAPTKPKSVATPPVESMPQSEPGLLDNPMMLMAGGGLLLLLLGAGAFFGIKEMKRRKALSGEEESPDETETSGEIDEEVADSDMEHDATQVISQDSDEEDHDSTVILQAVPSHDDTVITDTETVITEAVEEQAPPEPVEETDDVIAEADVYLAYGIFQQAEELLTTAIAEKPDKEMYRVKLCETHYAAKNADAFLASATALHEHNSGAESAGWLKVASLGKDLCPDNDLFQGVDVAANIDGGVVASAPVEMDIDLGGDENAAESTDVDFDFELDEPATEDALDLPDLDESEEELALPDAESEESELEFDLEDIDALDQLDIEDGGESLDLDSPELDSPELELDTNEEIVEPDDISDVDVAESTGTETSSDDAFVDENLDFGLDEIDSAETNDKPEADELDIDITTDDVEETIDSDSAIDISMDMDLEADAEETTEDSQSESNETADDEFFDVSMDFESADADLENVEANEDTIEDTIEEVATDDDGAIDIGIDMEDGVLDIGIDMDADLDTDESDTDSTEDKSTTDTSTDESDDFDLGLPALDDVDEISTKLDLARAYMDMGDHDGTRSILDEVIAEGNDEQKSDAEELLKELDG